MKELVNNELRAASVQEVADPAVERKTAALAKLMVANYNRG